MLLFFWCSIALALLQTEGADGSTTWPYGNSILLKPKAGCPEGWKDNGFLFQDTVDENPSNNRSKVLHIDGTVGRSFVIRSFCFKERGTIATATQNVWPAGKYCMYRHKNWKPYNMTLGSIRMYDEKNNNKDTYEMTHDLVSVRKRKAFTLRKIYDYTEIYFSCQTSGNKNIPIELPISKPFYLLPYGSRDCQQVKWMVATREWIKYHTRSYKLRRQKSLPYFDIGSRKNRGITMYYCYYQSCNYTLKETKGVFQSPGFPGKSPDGQLCSWRIMVPSNHVIHVRFTNLSLYDSKDILSYSKNTNGHFLVWYTLPFHKEPTISLTSDHDLLFVFRSDKSHASTGFRAQYHISIPAAATPTVSVKTPPKTLKSWTKSSPTTTQSQSSTKAMVTESKSSTARTLSSKEPSPTPNPCLKNTKATTEKRTEKSTEKSTPQTEIQYNASYKDLLKASRNNDRNGPKMIVVIVIPVVCFIIGVLVLVIIVYQWRIRKTESRARTSKRTSDRLVINPRYERETFLFPTDNSELNRLDDVNQPLSRDKQDHEDVEYEKLNRATRNRIPASSVPKESEFVEDSGPNPLYHTLEGPDPGNGPGETNLESYELDSFKDSGPNPLYHTLEGPDPNNGPSQNQANSQSRESETGKDGGPNLCYLLEGSANNNGLVESRIYEDVDSCMSRKIHTYPP